MHYRIFDCWRFCAAVLVMVYHFMFFAPGTDAAVGPVFMYRFLPMLDAFFMISGFVIAARYAPGMTTVNDYRRFLRRRLARIYPLHLVTLLFFAGLGLAGPLGLMTFQDPARWAFSDLPLHLAMVHAWGTTDHLGFNYPSWSVSAEFFCYLLFPVVVLIWREAGLPGLCLLLFGWIAVLEAWSAQGVFPSGHWTDANTFGAYRALADFVAGGLAAALVAGRAIEVRSHVPGGLALAAAFAAMAANQSVHLTLALLFLAILLTGLSESARPRSTEFLAPAMGVLRLSFGIYLLHPVAEALFLSVLWNRVLAPMAVVGFYPYLAVPMVATVALAWTSARFFDGPLGRRIAGVGKPSAAPAPASLASA